MGNVPDKGGEMSNYKSWPMKKYLDDLAAKLPAPGGGSSAALTAATGAALISMVVNFTLGKPKYAQYEQELKVTLEKSEKLRQQFLNLVDLDVAAYGSKNLRDALDVPFMVTRLCYEGVKIAEPLVKIGNVNLITDVVIAVIMLEAAFVSARYNVDINLKSLADKKLTSMFRKELTLKEKLIKKIRIKTEEKVDAVIRG